MWSIFDYFFFIDLLSLLLLQVLVSISIDIRIWMESYEDVAIYAGAFP